MTNTEVSDQLLKGTDACGMDPFLALGTVAATIWLRLNMVVSNRPHCVLHTFADESLRKKQPTYENISGSIPQVPTIIGKLSTSTLAPLFSRSRRWYHGNEVTRLSMV
jgi:hypothetical protein